MNNMLDNKDEVYRAIAFDIAKARADFDKEIEDHLEELAYEDGFEDGFEKGFQQGLQEGRRLVRSRLVLPMIEHGLSIEEISRVTNISIDEIMEIVKDC